MRNRFSARATRGVLLGVSAGALTLALASPTLAQTQPAASADTSQVDEIVVSGRRPIAESEAAALAVQAKSDSLVSVAASDSVGRLPDQNIAQATSRLPGV